MGLMLAGFAGLMLAAAMASLYLWQERRLKRHEAAASRFVCRRWIHWTASPHARCRLTLRPHGRDRCRRRQFEPGDFDAAMVVTRDPRHVRFLLVLRHEGWRGRRAALLNLAGLRSSDRAPPDHFAT